MENVLLQDHRSSGSFELPKMSVGGRCRRSLGARSATLRGAYDRSVVPTWRPYHGQHRDGAWSSAPGLLPCATAPSIIYSSLSLPLLPSNHPPLLPLPPTATKYAAFPCLAAPPPPRSRSAVKGAAATNAVPSAAPAPPRQRDRRRRPPPPSTTEPTKTRKKKKKKPLERATPLPPAPAVNEALDDLEQEVAARNFVHDLLHTLAPPPPSSLPLPRFSLVAKASSPAAPAARLVPPAAPSCCNVEAATADAIRGLLRLQ